jgi:hypothetical protein
VANKISALYVAGCARVKFDLFEKLFGPLQPAVYSAKFIKHFTIISQIDKS